MHIFKFKINLNHLQYIMGQACSDIFENKSPIGNSVDLIHEEEYQNVEPQTLDPETKRHLEQLQNEPGSNQFFKTNQLKKHKGKNQYYQGEWRDKLKKGKGAYFVPGKFLYFGEFDVIPHGQGKFTSFQHKLNYEGTVKEGRISGKGRLSHLDGQFVFEGNIEAGKPTHGKLTVFNPETKERELTAELEDYPTKPAIINYADEKRYEGQINLKTFLPEGKGVMYYPNKNIYDGEWLAGQYHGKGTFKWSDGSSYEGRYQKGKKHGLGKFTYSSKKYYEGGFVNGKQEGEGGVYNAEGKVLQKGRWREGLYEGEKPKTTQ